MTAVVLRGDAAHLPLPDESVDLIMCSPPYFGLRSYTDDGEHYGGQIGSEATPAEYVAALLACTREWVRVLKPAGSLFVNLGDKYAGSVIGGQTTSYLEGGPHVQNTASHPRGSYSWDGIKPKSLLGLPWRYALGCIDELGLILRAEVVWSKPNGLPESVTDRVRRSHEQVFHFTRLPRYYAAVDEIREPHQPDTWRPSKIGSSAMGGRNASLPGGMAPYAGPNPLGKLPGSVWSIPSAPLSVPAHLGVDHFAAYPPELCRRVVLGWSPAGVCTACGEGRRPVADKNHVILQQRMAEKERPGLNNRHLTEARSRRRVEVDITGYACACTPYTDHPGTAGRDRDGQGYARETGRDAHPHGGVGVLPRTGPWREYHLDGWEPPPTRPSLVVDPFGGTGTTALVASVYGRTGVTVDRSADYCRLAAWRVRDPGERARALQVPKPPPVPDGQLDLFDMDPAS